MKDLKDLFKRYSSSWVKFDAYEIRKASDGHEYVCSVPGAHPHLYDPLQDSESLVLDAVNVGLLSMGRKSPEVIRDGIMEFVGKYGLLGIITALPAMPDFLSYEDVYLPYNPLINRESMDTMAYLDYFYPFQKLRFSKRGREIVWTISGDNEMIALALATKAGDETGLAYQREYAERYDWLESEFKNLAFCLVNCFLYYLDYDALTPEARKAYQIAMQAYDAVMPTYHLELRDKLTLTWKFCSLLQEIQMMYYLMLVDDPNPIRFCRYCQKAYIVRNGDEKYCSSECAALDAIRTEKQKHKSDQ